VGHAARRLIWIDRIHLPAGISLRAFLLSLLIPGYAFVVRRERLIGRIIMASYAVLALTFVVCLGFPLANLGFGLMLSLHVSSIIFLLNPWLVETRLPFRLPFRIASGFAVLLVVGAALYTPLRNQLETKWLLPLRVNESVVIVQTFTPVRAIKRGDWMAYSLAAKRSAGLYAQEGLGLRPVLAVAGDRVHFRAETFEVNGIAAARLPHMPTAGELVVPEKSWFLWPEPAISNRGNAAESAISAAMLQWATVSETQFIGKPFNRWFGRRQKLS
jgi:hypothetical protein